MKTTNLASVGLDDLASTLRFSTNKLNEEHHTVPKCSSPSFLAFGARDYGFHWEIAIRR